tara:strand:+ start:662 stop:1138 length:477 start_codon:yes stop_codon:yes gene_type:complete
MKENKQNPYGIKTPETIEECRVNLRKYYVTLNTNGEREDDNLYVQENDRFPIKEFNSFSSIYDNVKSPSPHICPMVTLKKDVIDHMRETGQTMSSDGFFEDENNFTIWDDQEKFLESGDPKWVTLDNQIYREFYMMTLGKFSGYVWKDVEEPVKVMGK